jgi:hypothetical protein
MESLKIAVGCVALMLIGGALFYSCAFALWQENGNPVCTAKGDQLSTEAIQDGAGGAIITWYNGGVYAQRVDTSGTMLWKANGTAISSAPGSQLPYLISDGAAGAIITWADFRSATSYDIYAQRVDGSGKLLWPANGVPICTTACNERCRDITSDGDGGAIITWSDDRTGSGCDVYAQRVDASGRVLWKPNGVPVCSVKKDQGFTQIVSDGAGGAVIAWADFRSGDNFSIYAQRVDRSGRTLWQADGVPVCTARGSRLPRITSDGAGGAIITWRDPRNTTNYDIYAQRIDGSGKTLWQTDGIPVCTVAGAKWWPLIASDGTGGAIITWRDYRSGTNFDIFAQRVSSSGKVLWKVNGIPICTNALNERYHDMASDGARGAIIAWYDERGSGNYDIYAQRVASSGEVLWKVNGVAVCTATEDQQYPNVTADESGNAMVTWLDFRSGTNYDVYAQRLRSDGTTGPTRGGTDLPKSGVCR